MEINKNDKCVDKYVGKIIGIIGVLFGLYIFHKLIGDGDYNSNSTFEELSYFALNVVAYIIAIAWSVWFFNQKNTEMMTGKKLGMYIGIYFAAWVILGSFFRFFL